MQAVTKKQALLLAPRKWAKKYKTLPQRKKGNLKNWLEYKQ